MRTCIILGGADCVWDDLASYVGPNQGVIACNDIGTQWHGDLLAWVSLHADRFDEWIVRRREFDYPDPVWFIGHQKVRTTKVEVTPMEYRFPGQKASGSSGLFCAKVALIDLGFDEVVFCGVPMTGQRHFIGGRPWDAYEQFRKGWEEVPQKYLNRMASMSGWSADLVGRPRSVENA